jgi:tetratricopeptide (TPR) repeat protein
MESVLPHRRLWAIFLAGIVLAFAGCSSTDRATKAEPAPSTAARPSAEYEADKKQALDLYYSKHDLPGAISILERLIGENPEDRDVIELLAGSLFSYSSALEEGSAERKNAILRSRELAQKAKDMGSKFLMMDLILESVSAEGNVEVSFSKDKAIDEAMKKGEAAFARNDLEGALEAYQLAEALDPGLYVAPLYIGDCYYIMRKPDEAGVAFARAIAIDPNRETAYRYWGDALMKAGRMQEARGKFLEAIVAEPYSRLSWNGLSQWGALNGKQIGHYQFKIPVSEGPDGTLALDQKALSDTNGTRQWLQYGAARTLWRKKEQQYRHSLAEESSAVRAMLAAVDEQLHSGELKSSELDWPIQLLMRLDEEGLLEPYILLALADQGISQDYEPYRAEHREAIRLYLDRYVIHDKK